MVMSYNGLEIRVGFQDTDHSGRVYFLNYAKWMDIEIVEFFRYLGFNFRSNKETKLKSKIFQGTFVIGECCFRINVPSKFDDIVIAVSKVVEIKPKTVKIETEVIDKRRRIVLAVGTFTFIWVKGEKSARIPVEVINSLESSRDAVK